MDKVICSMCGAQFDTKEKLDKHNAEAHSDAMHKKEKHEGLFICQTCKAKFLTHEDLEEHNEEVHGNM